MPEVPVGGREDRLGEAHPVLGVDPLDELPLVDGEAVAIDHGRCALLGAGAGRRGRRRRGGRPRRGAPPGRRRGRHRPRVRSRPPLRRRRRRRRPPPRRRARGRPAGAAAPARKMSGRGLPGRPSRRGDDAVDDHREAVGEVRGGEHRHRRSSSWRRRPTGMPSGAEAVERPRASPGTRRSPPPRSSAENTAFLRLPMPQTVSASSGSLGSPQGTSMPRDASRLATPRSAAGRRGARSSRRPCTAARRPRSASTSSNTVAQARMCTSAVGVMTPSRSNSTAAASKNSRRSSRQRHSPGSARRRRGRHGRPRPARASQTRRVGGCAPIGAGSEHLQHPGVAERVRLHAGEVQELRDALVAGPRELGDTSGPTSPSPTGA